MRIVASLFYGLALMSCCISATAQMDDTVMHPVINPTLQQHYIQHIFVAPDKKLWLSTNIGLIRYDGNDARVMRENPFGVFRTFPGKNGLYLIDQFGLNYLHYQTGKQHFIDIKVPSEDSSTFLTNIYLCVLEDDDESLWIGRINMGLLYFNKTTKEAASYQIFSADKRPLSVECIIKDVRDPDTLWLGTGSGIYSFDKKNRKLTRNFSCINPLDSGINDARISKMHMNGKDEIWFTAGRSIGCYYKKTGQYKMFPGGKHALNTGGDFVYLQPKNEYEYYIGSGTGFPGLFNTTTRQYRFPFTTVRQYPSLQLNHFAQDSSGTLWSVIHGQLHKANTARPPFGRVSRVHPSSGNFTADSLRGITWSETDRKYYAILNRSNSVVALNEDYSFNAQIPLELGNDKNSNNGYSHLNDITIDGNNRIWLAGDRLYYSDIAKSRMVALNVKQQFRSIVARGDYVYLQPANSFSRSIYRIDSRTMFLDSIRLHADILRKTGDSLNWDPF
ncbi:MAG TPA: hypothetical protein VGD17_09930, partial [Chitinophagaceae bacterium]